MTTQREPDTSAEGLRRALKAARDAIAKAPDDTWGIDTMGDADVPGGLMSWPVKDEILHNIDRTLADAAGQATPVPPPPWHGLMKAPSRLRWWRGKVSAWLNSSDTTTKIPLETPDGVSLDQELEAAASWIEARLAPVPPPVEGLETTEEEREKWLGSAIPVVDRYEASMWHLKREESDRLIRDFTKVHDRAEGLAKEVERLKAELATANAAERLTHDLWLDAVRKRVRQKQEIDDLATRALPQGSEYLCFTRGAFNAALEEQRATLARAEAAEAKLAVYEAPVADGEQWKQDAEYRSSRETANRLLDQFYADPDDDLSVLSRQLLRADERVARLSHVKAEAKAREAKLQEALEFYANPEVYKPHPHGPAFDRRDLSGIARAALASSSPTKEKSDG